jgi:hypothetical protein
MIAFLLAAAQALASPPATPAPSDSVQVHGTDLERAMNEFQALCLAHPFDRAAFDAAASGSSWKYQRQPSTLFFADEWRSSHAYATFNTEQAAARGMALPQCNFLAATSRKVGSDAIVAAVGAMLRSSGVPDARYTRNEDMMWSWKRPDGLAQLHLIDPGPDGQVIRMSLQFWTPEWLARAPAFLEEAKRRGLAYTISNKKD